MMTGEVQGGKFPRLIQAAIDAFSLPDLRAKILFTLAILALYRFIAHIPLPGIDQIALDNLFRNNQLLGFLDLFSGGALSRMSIVAASDAARQRYDFLQRPPRRQVLGVNGTNIGDKFRHRICGHVTSSYELSI